MAVFYANAEDCAAIVRLRWWNRESRLRFVHQLEKMSEDEKSVSARPLIWCVAHWLLEPDARAALQPIGPSP